MIALVIFFSSSACTQSQVSYTEGSAIWKVTDTQSDNVIYLFGSIHVAEETLYPLNDTIMDAYASCDYLAVEVDLLAYNEDTALQLETANALIYTDDRTITDEIDEELVNEAIEILERYEASQEIPISMMPMLKPYTWVSLLTEIATEKAGLSSELGIDMHFLALARDDGKEILEIESIESQIDLLTGFSSEIQTYLFMDALKIDEGTQNTKYLYELWQDGDLETILEEEEEMDENTLAAAEEYNRLILTERNERMTETAITYLKEGKQVFFVVGGLHMVGDDSIVQQLIDREYKVERL